MDQYAARIDLESGKQTRIHNCAATAARIGQFGELLRTACGLMEFWVPEFRLSVRQSMPMAAENVRPDVARNNSWECRRPESQLL